MTRPDQKAPHGTDGLPPDTAHARTGPKRGSDLGALARAVFTAQNSTLVTVLAVVVALVAGAVLMVVSDPQTLAAWNYVFVAPGYTLSATWKEIASGYGALFDGAILRPDTLTQGSLTLILKPLTDTLARATPLLFGGLAVTVAFRAGLFNIGGQGQLIFGAIASCWVGFAWHLPVGVHLLAAVLAGALGGVLYGAVAGLLKAYRGAHEVIVTIMLNYVALYLLNWVINTREFHDPTASGQAISKSVDADAQLPHIFGSALAPTLGLPLALAAAVAVAWLLKRSASGFEIRAVGLNPDAARTAGISVRRVQVTALALSGLLFGLVGMYQVLAAPSASAALTPNLDANLGFDAITVALLGRTSPWGVVGASLLWGALDAGSATMQASAGIPVEIVEIVQALIVIFVAAPRLIQEIFRLRASRADGPAPAAPGPAAPTPASPLPEAAS
ncbi:ABC transporter permease [Streptomyces sp. NPDC002788]